MKKELMILFFILSLFFIPSISAVSINEVMPNPDDGCNDCTEWVELYSNESVDLEGWILDTSDSKNTFFHCLIQDYLIITKNKSAFLQLWPGIDESKVLESKNISLKNEEDTIILNNTLVMVDNTTYPSFSNNKNWTWSLCEGWIKTNIATPSIKNNCPSISLEFPPYIIKGEPSAVLMNVSGYDNGLYDIKIDIFNVSDPSHRISKIWDPQEQKWKSTNYYLYEVLNIINNQASYLTFLKIEDYIGPAIIYSKIRKGSASPIENPTIYLTNIVDFSQQQNQSNQSQQNQQSYIAITDADEEAAFGDIVNVKLNIYRGDTGKYAVYVRVEQDNGYDVSEETTIHVMTKYVNYSLKVPVQLKLNCDEKYKEGDYFIIVEGLDENVTQEIKLSGKSALCNSATNGSSSSSSSSTGVASQGGLTYEVTVPEEAIINREIETKIKIENSEDYQQKVEVWSYVYRGSKCYSCDESKNETREQNKEQVIINALETEEIILTNIVPEAEDGDYKLKVKILKQDYKTPKEFTFDIFLQTNKHAANGDKETTQVDSYSQNKASDKITGSVIESTGTTVLKITPYLLALLSLFIALYIIKLK